MRETRVESIGSSIGAVLILCKSDTDLMAVSGQRLQQTPWGRRWEAGFAAWRPSERKIENLQAA